MKKYGHMTAAEQQKRVLELSVHLTGEYLG